MRRRSTFSTLSITFVNVRGQIPPRLITTLSKTLSCLSVSSHQLFPAKSDIRIDYGAYLDSSRQTATCALIWLLSQELPLSRGLALEFLHTVSPATSLHYSQVTGTAPVPVCVRVFSTPRAAHRQGRGPTCTSRGDHTLFIFPCVAVLGLDWS